MNVKVCGLTRLEDARLACELGAWAVGFIFFPKSPRFILPEEAAEIIRALPPEVLKVGVFVNAPFGEVSDAIQASGITALQLHGNESPEFCESFNLPVIKAFRPKKDADIDAMGAYSGCHALLVDAAVEGFWGGTGRLSEWTLASAATRHGRLILSGGLNPENVKEAILSVNPFAIDVSSGLEESPGRKNSQRMRMFFERVAEAREAQGRLT